MNEVMRFWMDKNVSGFRVDAIVTLFEVAPDAQGNLPDEPKSGACNDPNDHCYLNHIYTNDLDEDYDMVYQWREVLEKYRKENGGIERILMTEGSGKLEKIIQAYGDGKRNGSQIPFNFYFMLSINGGSKASDYKNVIANYLSKIPAGYRPNWVVRKSNQHYNFYQYSKFTL